MYYWEKSNHFSVFNWKDFRQILLQCFRGKFKPSNWKSTKFGIERVVTSCQIVLWNTSKYFQLLGETLKHWGTVSSQLSLCVHSGGLFPFCDLCSVLWSSLWYMVFVSFFDICSTRSYSSFNASLFSFLPFFRPFSYLPAAFLTTLKKICLIYLYLYIYTYRKVKVYKKKHPTIWKIYNNIKYPKICDKIPKTCLR